MATADSNNVITEVLIAILGGGLVTAAANILNARTNRRNLTVTEAKAPVEINLSSIEGAEKAVLSLGKALDAANAHAADLERELTEKVEEVRQLQRECQALREQLLAAKRALRHYLTGGKGDEPYQGLLDGAGVDEG